MAEKVHNLGADACKVMLTNTAPVATNSVKADLTEIAAGNGYTAGGNVATVVTSAQTSGTYKLVLADPATWTAAGGTIGPFRYVVLLNTTPAAGPLIGWWDNGAPNTLQINDTFVADLDGTNGVIQIV